LCCVCVQFCAVGAKTELGVCARWLTCFWLAVGWLAGWGWLARCEGVWGIRCLCYPHQRRVELCTQYQESNMVQALTKVHCTENESVSTNAYSVGQRTTGTWGTNRTARLPAPTQPPRSATNEHVQPKIHHPACTTAGDRVAVASWEPQPCSSCCIAIPQTCLRPPHTPGPSVGLWATFCKNSATDHPSIDFCLGLNPPRAAVQARASAGRWCLDWALEARKGALRQCPPPASTPLSAPCRQLH
jgi:hypothetical protein